MLCALTIRQLKPGSYDDFRRAWEPDEWPSFITRAYLMRHQDDLDQVASFGFIDMSVDDFDAVRDDASFLAQEARRVERMAAYEETILVNGVFELAEEVIPPRSDD